MIDVNWVPLGFVRRAHGVRGQLRLEGLSPELKPPACPFAADLRARDGTPLLRTKITRARAVHDAWLVDFADVTQREQATALKGAQVFILREALPALAPGEFYYFELEGAQVEDVDGHVLGKAGRVVDNNGQPLLEVNMQAGLAYVPLIEQTVRRFDRDGHTLILDVAEGLLDV